MPFIIGVDDEGRHLVALRRPARTPSARGPAERYVEGFENIRRLQGYVKSQALSHGVPVMPNYSFDQAIAAVMDLVMEHATQRPRRSARRRRHTDAADLDGGTGAGGQTA